MNYKLLFLFCLVGSYTSAQTLEGTIYNATQTLPGVSVKNLSRNIQTQSTSNGSFVIAAAVNDSISFYLFPYAPQLNVITAKDMTSPIVIELKEVNNELDEVLLRNTPKKETTFSAPAYEQTVQQSILGDIDKNGHLYVPPASTYGINFVALFKKARKLFKKKDGRRNAKTATAITSLQLEKLFRDSPIFNDDFLYSELGLPQNSAYYFFDYCESRQLDTNLLKPKNSFLLIDKLITLSEEYKELLNSLKE
ncbi:hypothetical protein ACFO5T_02200 [Dokdonia genika]|uniref:Carboxypeptidase-like protein n=1 Tax=Dokdonia genika TaxID=308113 RepID=A0ABV9L5M7_9FLAO